MAKGVKQPIKKLRPRTCVGCGEESPKRTLLRVVRQPDGAVRYDPPRMATGRGAYVCAAAACIAAAKKKKSHSRALKAEAPDALYDELTALCDKRGERA